MGKLDGKIALITGGTTGIGLATAKIFQEQGAQVIITGRNRSTLDEAAKQLGSKAAVMQSDTAKLSDIAALMTKIKADFGRIDVLFANAGIAKFIPFEQSNEAFFDDQFNTNVKGLYFTIQHALPLIPDGGAIVLNASVAATKGLPGSSVYAATKAAVRSFGRTLASELAGRKIRVNTISPGPIDTPIFGKMGMPPEAVKEFESTMEKTVALKRFGKPEEIGQAALFLASSDSSYITGVNLFADGGFGEL